MSFSFKKATALAYLLVFSMGAQAGLITLKTGWDEVNNRSLNYGQHDSTWQVTTNWNGPNSNVGYQTAKTLYRFEKDYYMQQVRPTANWIGTQYTNNGQSDWRNSGNYDGRMAARTQFDLSGIDLNSVHLSGYFRAADYLDDIFINNVRIGGWGTGAGAGDADTYSGGDAWRNDFHLGSGRIANFSDFLLDGVNTLTFVARTMNGYMDGFYFDGRVDFADPIPDDNNGNNGNNDDAIVTVSEPGTFALLGLGLLGLGLSRRKA